MAWVSSTVVQCKTWAPGLLTLELDTVLDQFNPGQFVNLGLDDADNRIKRSYSIASAPGERCQLYISKVPHGQLTPRLFQCEPGSAVWLDTRALGFFTLDHIPRAHTLWLLATGTGLGPFLSFLRTDKIWGHAQRVVLAHGVRSVAELGYRQELLQLQRERPDAFTYVPCVSRAGAQEGAEIANCHLGRITEALAQGELEERAAASLLPEDSHVLLCGNPAMIDEVQVQLATRGMRKHRVRKPGHISFESYW